MKTSPLNAAYAVVGFPISHSKSPLIHQQFAEQTQQSITYEAIAIAPGSFKQQVTALFAENYKGLNVTVPFKEEAYALADQLSERAQAAQAVNTLILQADGSLLGDNTDGAGLVQDLLRFIDLKDKSVLLIGAGGAAKGVLLPLLQQQPKCLHVSNRTLAKAQQLAAQWQQQYPQLSSQSMLQLQQCYDVVINATSASLGGNQLPLPEVIIGKHTLCYDMMYAKQETVFNQWARQLGAQRCVDGLGMLVGQAAESFYLWRQVRPKIQPVMLNLRN